MCSDGTHYLNFIKCFVFSLVYFNPPLTNLLNKTNVSYVDSMEQYFTFKPFLFDFAHKHAQGCLLILHYSINLQ